MSTWIDEGTVNSDCRWVLNTNSTITLDTTGLVFSKDFQASDLVANGGITKSGNTISLTTGIATVGTYKSVTVDTNGRVTGGTNPSTIAGYGITDFASNVLSTVLIGLSTATNSVISVTDTVLSSLGKLQKQISDNLTTLSTHITDAVKHITSAERTLWNGKLDKTGGHLNGDLILENEKSIYLKYLDGSYKIALTRNSDDKTIIGDGTRGVVLSVPNGASAEIYNCAIGDYQKIYSEGNKPSLSALGITTPTVYTPTLLNSWINNSDTAIKCGYYKTIEGIVHLQGSIKSGITTDGTVLFTLPVGFRPHYVVITSATATNGSDLKKVQLNILTDGSVNIYLSGGYNTWLSLENISFATF